MDIRHGHGTERKKTKMVIDPTLQQMEAELKRLEKQDRVMRAARNLLFSLITAAAAAALLAIYVLSLLRINGNSMDDTLHDGDLVVVLAGSDYEAGDIIAFYHNNEILVKRLIAEGGDIVDIDEAGNVSVNGSPLEEPYIKEESAATGGTEFPCEVPEGRIFVLGDNRPESMDSRSSSVGCIKESKVVGKVFFRLRPFGELGFLG